MGGEPASGNVVDTSSRSRHHGVLFVHGIGLQPKSSQLLWFGDPLVDWLKAWYTARGEPIPRLDDVDLGFQSYDPGGQDFQPRVRLRLWRPDPATNEGVW